MSTIKKIDHFNKNSPRPPVPGEETEVVGLELPAPSPFPSHTSTWGGCHKLFKGEDLPVLTPRRSSLAGSLRTNVADHGAPLGFEPEGRCGGGGGGGDGHHPLEHPPSSRSIHSPLPYLRWARNLHDLLEDSDGVYLFRKYLEQEGRPHADTLDFWFACEGLKKQSDPDRITQLVKVIHRRFFLKTQLAIPEDLRKDVNRRIREGKEILHQGIFDTVQTQVEQLINKTTYPNFLKSELYLQHVQAMQNGASGSGESGSSSGSSSSRELPGVVAGCMLQTVHEDAELSLPVTTHSTMSPSISAPSEPARLTHDMLMATQSRRAVDLKPKTEAFAGRMYFHRSFYNPLATQTNPHLLYNSYNPVSRQDSELQSLSSDARTESDTMSITDSSVDGRSIGCSRSSHRQPSRHSKQMMRESASLNRDPPGVIPRTAIVPKEPLDRNEFAEILITKLNALKKEKEAAKKLASIVHEGDEGKGLETASGNKNLADELRERLMFEDDNGQSILDEHVSRVWSDLTPARSPGFDSPRQKSPEARRRVTTAYSTLLPQTKSWSSGGTLGGPHRDQARAGYSSRHVRKEKDVSSLHSTDSGTVYDFMDVSEHRYHVPKSKSMPDYGETLKQDPSAGHRDTGRRSTNTRKPHSEQADSGVSVVSDTPPVVPAQIKDGKVLSWLHSDRQLPNESSWHTRSEREVSSSSKHRMRSTSATSPITSRHSRKQGCHQSGSRSDSLERGVSKPLAGSVGSAQPYMADPSTPPSFQLHAACQQEDIRRRPWDDHRQRHRHSTGGKAEATHSNPSTLRRTSRSSGRPSDQPTSQSQEYVVVFILLGDEQVPYLVKIPGRSVTLRQFKEMLPKKGNYRYFFKTECEDLDNQVIQEEITDDNEVLPFLEGRIMATVKPIE